MDKKQLSVEQKAHDLAVAYATYSVSSMINTQILTNFIKSMNEHMMSY